MSKTQSALGVTIKENVIIPNIELYNASQVFADVAGIYKLNFGEGGVSISNQSTGLFTTDIPNDQFVSAIRSSKWLVTFSGYATTPAGANEELIIALYKNGVLYDRSYTVFTFESNGNFYSFSRTVTIDVAVTDTLDVRFSKMNEDVTVARFNLSLIQTG